MAPGDELDGTGAQHLIRTMYSSAARDDITDAMLSEIVEQSRRNNERDGLTGVLVHRDGRFLQVLEGPEDAVTDRMRIISADARHHRVRTLLTESVVRRAFPGWTLGFRTGDEASPAGSPELGAPAAPASPPDADDGGSERTWLAIIDRLTHWYREESGDAGPPSTG